MTTRAEYIADSAIHVLGIALGIGATVTLAILTWPGDNPGRFASLAVYSACLMAMLVASALYNMISKDEKTGVLRRLDHAAIFLMIAGTYTPFSAFVIGGRAGSIILAVVWTGAITGALVKLFAIHRLEKITIPVCLALGYVIVFAYEPLLMNTSEVGFWFLIAGGALYTLGTAFYAWKSLPFQNAIWHGFVLAAAICHFVAIVSDVALPGLA